MKPALLVFLVLCLVPGLALAGSHGRDYVPGRILVRFRSGTGAAMQQQAVQTLGGHLGPHIAALHVTRVNLPAGTSVAQAVKAWSARPGVAHAQPDFIYRPLDTTPNDPDFGQQWGLHNPRYPGDDIHAPQAWDHVTDCSDVLVAVVDSGINYTQADLQGEMWNGGSSYPHHGYDFVAGDNDPQASDGAGHGTHVAGIIGAAGNNGTDTAGVCWHARIMALRALGISGGTTSTVAQAVNFAVSHGARVINMSLGGSQYDQVLKDAIDNARSNGVLVVAAAGNDGADDDSSPTYPCAFGDDNIVCVAALDQSYGLASYSNYGAKTVDVGAPGSTIVSLWPGSPLTGFQSWLSSSTSQGNWGVIANSCTSSSQTYILADPSGTWCAGGTSTSSNDYIYHDYGFASPSVLGIGLQYEALYTTEGGGTGYFNAAYKAGGGNPFDPINPGTQLDHETGSTGNTARAFSDDLSGCLNQSSCTLGFQMHTSSAAPSHSGAVVALEVLRSIQDSNATQTESGTSMATAFVSGIAAMLYAYNPHFGYRDVITAIDRGGVADPALAGNTVSGRAADAMGALAYIQAPTGIKASVH
ncbi:MAG TPA: S8 family serine peptidase [Gammaproteobacteria bacterium]|nr:S8 family serine peptidase [Gammaproteobacteria bacterium]